MKGAAERPPPIIWSMPARQFCASLRGRSLTNMYLVFAQFGTGLV
jgi:hypothetical protein